MSDDELVAEADVMKTFGMIPKDLDYKKMLLDVLTEQIAGFYDQVIAPNQVRFRIDESYASGNECANIGCISTTMGDGTRVDTNGVFTYRVDTEGRITALRAYWEMDRLVVVQPV